MDDINKRWYSRASAVSAFARDDLLEPSLVLLLVRLQDRIVGRDVLDLGVGAGRTTLYLSALTPRYVGIDYSPTMVAHTARRFPDAAVDVGDARDLSRFPAASFDFVLFSYAGIDALDHESRLRVMAEVGRVLRPGGVFVFSVHNRDYREARTHPRVAFSRNPITLAANVARWARSSMHHARLRRLERECAEYALINDLAEGYSLLHYYIDAAHQREQLARTGLAVDFVLDDRGGDVPPERTATESAFLWFVAHPEKSRVAAPDPATEARSHVTSYSPPSTTGRATAAR
jgi:SAM-dependent methyltransferase